MRRRDAEKERRVKEAVVKLILRDGMEGASIAKIAREAGVSPATVYIYYDSKEQMLQNLYREYAAQAGAYLMARVREEMDGPQFIRSLIRGYYQFIAENTEIYSFVEQCSHCPVLSDGVSDLCRSFELIRRMQSRGVLRPYGEESLAAILFYPVKAIATEYPPGDPRADASLEELIEIVQRAVLF